MKALTFETFVASQRIVGVAEASRILGAHPDDFGDDPGFIHVFADCCYALTDGAGGLFAPIFQAEARGEPRDVMWSLYWDFYLPECNSRDALTTAILSDALRIFCERESLPLMSADELIHHLFESTEVRPLPASVVKQMDDIEWFIEVWNAVQKSEDEART